MGFRPGRNGGNRVCSALVTFDFQQLRIPSNFAFLTHELMKINAFTFKIAFK